MVDRPIFVVGMGRSGTTLLTSLLSGHSRIALTTETHFMTAARLTGGLSPDPRSTPPEFESFWRDYQHSVRFSDLGLDPARCNEILRSTGDYTFRGAVQTLLAASRERFGTARIGEKTPGHVHYIEHLLRWFPDSRIIVLRRDPRAVVASMLRSPWVQARLESPPRGPRLLLGRRLAEVAYYAEDWAKTYKNVVSGWSSEPRVHLVSYESLVEETEKVLRDLCSFIGEPYEAGMMKERQRRSTAVPEARMHDERHEEWRRRHYEQVVRPISTKSLTKWSYELQPREVAMIEGRCEREMRPGGYRPRTAWPIRLLGAAFAISAAATSAAERRTRRLLSRQVVQRMPRRQ